MPIIPLIASYELELDTESFLYQSWEKVRLLIFGKKEAESSIDITEDQGFRIAGCVAIAIQFDGLEHHEEEVVNSVLESEKIDQDYMYVGKWRDDIFLFFIRDPEQAIKTAINIRNALLYFDWMSKTVCHPSNFRITLDMVTEKQKATDDVMGFKIHDLYLLNSIVAHSCNRKYELLISESVLNDVASALDALGVRVKPIFQSLSSGNENRDIKYGLLYCKKELDALDNGLFMPIMDKQYYRREGALKRFSYMWLLLDQLPRGSWGRSIPIWMGNVWKGLPTFIPNSIMEDEGGFETSILNMQLLVELSGVDISLAGVGEKAIAYLEDRYVAGGFGTISASRHGYGVEPQHRHTALAAWLLGKVLFKKTKQIPEWRNLFKLGALSLFGGDKEQSKAEFVNDRNPLLLYIACWHISDIINSEERCRELQISGEEQSRMLELWGYIEPSLRDTALTTKYTPRPSLVEGEKRIYPLTIPYGRFVRMESYSLLTAALLVNKRMPDMVRSRLCDGVKYIIDKYMKCYGDPEKRWGADPLQPKVRGVQPYFVDDVDVPPDLGSNALLIRILRSSDIRYALWGDSQPNILSKVRYFLTQDLVDLFDRSLIEPSLYQLTNAGMLASILVGDSNKLIRRMVDYLGQKHECLPSIEIKDDNINEVLSEEYLDALVNDVIATDSDEVKIQLATYSLSRHYLEYLRPGRYAHDALTKNGRMEISDRTLKVYKKREFSEKFYQTWKDSADISIVAPYTSLINKGGRILDVGCGVGQYAKYFAKNGFVVELMDGSDRNLEYAVQQLLDAGVENTNTYSLNIVDSSRRDNIVVNAPYDGIWCSGLFSHLLKDEQIQLLKWFNKLLTKEGVLFVNVMIDNPRLFAHDGRFYGYVPSADDFKPMLLKTGFEVEQILTKTMRENTYSEPTLSTSWANFYALKENNEKTDDKDDMASHLTSLAYHRSVKEFVRVHRGISGTSVDKEKAEVRSRYINSLLDKLEGLVRKSEKLCILDAGCGTGDFVYEMAKRGWESVGVDLSDEMIKFARNNAPEKVEGIGSVVLQVADLRKLPIEWTEKFDAIISVTVFQHLPLGPRHALGVFKQMSRVLKNGGIFRFDVQLERGAGFDPDLRYIQGYRNIQEAKDMLNYTEAGFSLVKVDEEELPMFQNAFERGIKLKFAIFWLKKV